MPLPYGAGSATLCWASGGATDRGKVRALNQDAYLDRPDLGLWAVADGMGGHRDGALASKAIVDALGAMARPRLLGSGARAAREQLRSVNRELMERAALPGGELTGSTVVVLVAVRTHCALLWVGDSRIYRLRDGKLSQLTTDHSQVQAMVDANLLTPQQAARHPLSNVLTRAVGSDSPLDVDGRIDRARDGDHYLLCSDGLFRELSEREIADTVASCDPADGARTLVQLACNQGGRDNVTAVIVRCRTEVPPVSTAGRNPIRTG